MVQKTHEVVSWTAAAQMVGVVFRCWARRRFWLRAFSKRNHIDEALAKTGGAARVLVEWHAAAQEQIWRRKQQEMAALLAQAGAELVAAGRREVHKGRAENSARRAGQRLGLQLARLRWERDAIRAFVAWARAAAALREERCRYSEGECLPFDSHGQAGERLPAGSLEHEGARRGDAAAWQSCRMRSFCKNVLLQWACAVERASGQRRSLRRHDQSPSWGSRSFGPMRRIALSALTSPSCSPRPCATVDGTRCRAEEVVSASMATSASLHVRASSSQIGSAPITTRSSASSQASSCSSRISSASTVLPSSAVSQAPACSSQTGSASMVMPSSTSTRQSGSAWIEISSSASTRLTTSPQLCSGPRGSAESRASSLGAGVSSAIPTGLASGHDEVSGRLFPKPQLVGQEHSPQPPRQDASPKVVVVIGPTLVEDFRTTTPPRRSLSMEQVLAPLARSPLASWAADTCTPTPRASSVGAVARAAATLRPAWARGVVTQPEVHPVTRSVHSSRGPNSAVALASWASDGRAI